MEGADPPPAQPIVLVQALDEDEESTGTEGEEVEYMIPALEQPNSFSIRA